MKLYAQYLGILSSIEYVNPLNLFTTETNINPYDYTLYEVKNDGLLASCEFKSFEFKNGVDSSLIKFIVGLSGNNVVVDSMEFVIYLDKASIVAKLSDVTLTLSDINTVISAGVSRLLPKTKAGNIVFKISLYGHRTDAEKPSQLAVWHSRGHPETYIVIPEREKEEPIDRDRLSDTVQGDTSLDYIDALDWKCIDYHYKTIILKNTGTSSLKCKINVYSHLGGSAHEEVAETTLTAGETLKVTLNYIYVRTVVQVKNETTTTTYRIDYVGSRQ